MSRDNSAGFLQGFSVCQPFFGAALQFYPALGTKQLDDLINSYIPGPSSIRQKRATVSMEFFKFSQLTGNTFKFYPVLTHSSYSATASSAEASPPLGSAANSSLVSPVISDWTSSQPSSSNLSVSTPSSTSHEPVSLGSFKEGCSGPAKGQVNDFSHIPGMKIMTKDGIDVTNSASRGRKTKAQRDHAHLMRIIKACDSCKKKKVRCDPSHKKRTVSQARAASSSARPAKKARTLVPDLRFAGQPGSKDVEAAIEPSAVIREDMFVELAEPWGTPSLFTNESARISSIDYDFFIDPEGYLSPVSELLANQPSHDNSITRPPVLPYMDEGVFGNNYVDFNLYSPEPSFLDDNSAFVMDITPAGGKHATLQSQQGGLDDTLRKQLAAKSTTSASSLGTTCQFLEEHGIAPQTSLNHSPAMDRGRDSSPSSPGASWFQPTYDGPKCPKALLSVSRLCLNRGSSSSCPKPALLTSQGDCDCPALDSITSLNTSPTAVVPPSLSTAVGNDNDSLAKPHASSSTSLTSSIGRAAPTLTVCLFSLATWSPTTVEEVSNSAETTTTTTTVSLPMHGSRLTPSKEAAVGSCPTSFLVADVAQGSDSEALARSSACPLPGFTTLVDVADVTDGGSARSTMALAGANLASAFATGSSFTATAAEYAIASACHTTSAPPSTLVDLLTSTAILVAVLGVLALLLRTQLLSSTAPEPMLCKTNRSGPRIRDSEPQQSRLSATLKPQALSNGAKLLSCFSNILRRVHSSNDASHKRTIPAVSQYVPSLVQRFH